MAALDVIELTDGKPFTAGMAVLVGGYLVATLNRDHLPPRYKRGWLRIGGVGGGQEPNETIDACAVREAREELGTAVEILSSPFTYLAADENPAEPIAATEPAPLLLTRMARPDPSPFAPGLPAGHELFGAVFLGRALGEPVPADDVAALLFVLPAEWPILTREPTLREAVAAGAVVVERDPLSPETRLWLHPDEAWGLVANLLVRHAELEPLLV